LKIFKRGDSIILFRNLRRKLNRQQKQHTDSNKEQANEREREKLPLFNLSVVAFAVYILCI